MVLTRIKGYFLCCSGRQGLVHLGRTVLLLYGLMITYFLKTQFNDKRGADNLNNVGLDVFTEHVFANDTFFTKMDKHNYVLSVYFDNRNLDNMYIRFISVHFSPIRTNKINLSCVLIVSGREVNIQAESYPFNENHALSWKGYMHSCSIGDILTTNPGSVDIVMESQNKDKKATSVTITYIKTLLEGAYSKEFAVCVPPLHDDVPFEQLIQFIETTKLLGNGHVYFYFDGLNKNIDYILHYYEEVGYATIHPWVLPMATESIWYHGQVLAIHHCLYSHMGQHKYIMFQDLDELLIPHNPTQQKWWPSLMAEIDDGEHSGFCFKSAFFPKKQENEIYFFNRTIRTDFSALRQKCMVRPDRIFEMGIHHISKWTTDSWIPAIVDTDIAFIHHYRQCTLDSPKSNICRPTLYKSDVCIMDIADQFLIHIKGAEDGTIYSHLAKQK